jgi:SH3-like domain-containing protein
MKKSINFGIIIIVLIIIFSACTSTDTGSGTKTLDTAQTQNTEEKTVSYTQADYLVMLKSGKIEAFTTAVTSSAVDINWADSDGASWLHHAVWEGRKDAATALIDAGIDVNVQRKDEYTALHWAAYKNYPEITALLLEAGADKNTKANGTTALMWAASKENDSTAMVLLENGANIYTAGNNRPSAMDYYKERFGNEITTLYRVYNSSVFAAVFKNPGAAESGKPTGPPYPEAQLEFEGVYNYLDGAVILVSVSNTGLGTLYQVAAEIKIKTRQKIFFGKIEPGETITHSFNYNNLNITDSGKDIPVTINFTEPNGYAPDTLNGKISLVTPDNTFVVDNLPKMNTADIRTCLSKNFFSQNDLNRAVILRGPDLKMEQIKAFISARLIDRTVIDKLIRYEKVKYSIEDIIFFAKNRVISQENLELVLLENRIQFTSENIVALANTNYISRQVVEALYLEGIEFSSSQVRKLISLKVFSLPEILYTYTINDGDSETSVGNRDGMIQIKEGVDFDFIIKNNSVFDLNNIKIALNSGESHIDLFNNISMLNSIKSGDASKVSSTIAVKPAFAGDKFSISISVKDNYFGTLVDKKLTIPVGRTTGSKVLTLNKKITSIENIIVRSGASQDSPQLASLSEGAVFDAVGELDQWYKVGIYGQYGWVKKSEVNDFTQKTESTFLVENRSDFAIGEGSGEYSERLFVNSRPELVILSPSNNDNVYNRVELEILAIDQSFGIDSVDIRINGKSIAGSGIRGLKVVNSTNMEFRKIYSLILNKGDNEVSVTAYNSKNVASDTKQINLYSQGVQNPPSLYALAIGVSEYQISSQNLNYAASDAKTIAAVFESQINSDIYDKVEVKTLVDAEATRSNIIDGINNFLSNARSDDVAVLFFAGHGITDSRGRYYLLGHDADINNPSANGLSQSAFEEDLVAAVQARKVIIMLDSCQSGGVTGRRGANDITEVVDNLSNATGFTIMSAARGNEYAYEDPDWNGGAFTTAIEEALKDNKADSNKDGFVDINELDSYVYDKVVELTGSKQHPTKKSLSAESYKFYQTR